MRYLLLLIYAWAASVQSLDFQILNEDFLKQHLQLAHPKNEERYRRLKDLFEESGCRGDAFHEQAVKGSKQPNVICEVAGNGESPRRIIVGAHFDAVGGTGIIDNWSGAVLLPAFAEFLRTSTHRHAFIFIGFAGEEQGLLGSRAYVKAMSQEDRERIAAVITMDSLGLTPTKCWTHGSTKELVSAAAGIAHTLKLDFQGVEVEAVGTTDSQSFKDANIPVTQSTFGHPGDLAGDQRQ